MKKNLIWIKFNRWVVTEELQPRVRFLVKYNREFKDRMFLCQCDCWNTQTISYSNLTKWISKSCWCLKSELARIAMEKFRPTQFWDKNPNWRWWIQTINSKNRNKLRNTKESRNWRKIILARDKFCQCCNSTENLQAHHIDNWATNPELRIEESNWICLCKSCHHEFHKEYWFTNNSIEQLEDFIHFAGA